jgi:hypothetical protein
MIELIELFEYTFPERSLILVVNVYEKLLHIKSFLCCNVIHGTIFI